MAPKDEPRSPPTTSMRWPSRSNAIGDLDNLADTGPFTNENSPESVQLSRFRFRAPK